MLKSTFAKNIDVCHHCEHSDTQKVTFRYGLPVKGCWGPCNCDFDKVSISNHAQKGECPINKFTQAGETKAISKPPDKGPGTELLKLIGRLGIHPTPTCSCRAHAAHMDVAGSDWCEANIETIISWLAVEAKSRGLPFVALAGKALVKLAINRSRK